MHLSILLLLHPFEPLKVNDKNWRAFEYLKLLDGLLVHFASAAKPCILVRQFLRGHKLSEAVVNSHFIVLKRVLTLPFSSFLRVMLGVLFKPYHVFKESPAFGSVE
jgi:hypothetical protein